jgi:hypothetical protein
MDKKKKSLQTPSEDRLKKESLERIVNAYHQAMADSDTPQIKRLESILRKLGYTKFIK